MARRAARGEDRGEDSGEDIVSISELYRPFGADVNLKELVGKEIIIGAVEWIQTEKYGSVPILTIKVGDQILRAITFSRVVIRQLKESGIEEALAQGKKVRARVGQKKNYIYLW